MTTSPESKWTTTFHGYGGVNNWSAIDADRYDGAEDTRFPGNAMGLGRTEAEAIHDLKCQLEDAGLPCP